MQQKIIHFFKGIGVSLERLTRVAGRRGKLGPIDLFRHPELGKVFVLNGEIQHVEAWAPLYHEPLVHLSVSFVSEVQDILILGGGTLYAASEALKYQSVRRVILIDHDSRVPEMAAQHYKHAKACLNDIRFTMLHEDAYSALTRFRNQFDLVLNDGADLTALKSQSQQRKSANVFSAMTTALKPNGVCADVIYRHLFEQRTILRTLNCLRPNTRVALSLVFLPEYHGILHFLSIWGRRSCSVTQTQVRPRNKEQLSWISNPASSPCVYYDPRFLRYYLYLPRYLKRTLTTKRIVV